jgi:formylmethanofuran dehydrogenase subunit C
MTVTLSLKKELEVPVSAECISPDIFAGKSQEEIAQLQLWEGNRQRALSDLFELEGESEDKPKEIAIRIFGDLSKVRRIGTRMTDGEIVVHGNVGMHVGEEMKGGTIVVEGNAGSWVGAAMRGGTIEVKGSAGDYIGGAYRGSTEGMKGGTIVIHGNAGVEVGGHMRKGLIKIHGEVDQFVGIRMKDGAIVVQGKAKDRAGAFMTGGKIVLCNYVPSVLPTFTIDGLKNRVKIEEEEIRKSFYLFVGDLTERGNGKLYIAKDRNEHLKSYETLL